jgi:hypothetical protein
MASLDLANTRAERVSVTNPTEGDLFVQPNGDFRLIGDVDAEVQAIGVRLKTYLGEVYTDTSAGIPWFQYIFANKAANPTVIKGFIRAEILARGSVGDVPILEFLLPPNRRATITWQGTLVTGQIIGASYTQGA